ncbi:helix-turn-helix domain-containing protein [bacterium]|nr:helix-turn-helix domain-containing protein [bacterium]
MSDIGSRLREERERLGLSQAKFAELGGAKRASQYNYEAGLTFPDANYLAAIASAGADPLYILTGDREQATPLNRDEGELLQRYRKLPDNIKRGVMTFFSTIDET